MRTGVTPPIKHQNKIFKISGSLKTEGDVPRRSPMRTEAGKKKNENTYATPKIPFKSSVGGLVRLGYMHYCTST